MKKLTVSDIKGPALYAQIRDDMRRRVIELKRDRRVAVGPMVTLVFENRATVMFQIEEMCRAEGITARDKIAEEVAVYNKLLPDVGELSATLLVEITEEAEIEPTLARLVGLQDHLWIEIDGERVRATFDPDQFTSDKFAAVQYLRFPLPSSARAALPSPGTTVRVLFDHPGYFHAATLSEAARASLARDLD